MRQSWMQRSFLRWGEIERWNVTECQFIGLECVKTQDQFESKQEYSELDFWELNSPFWNFHRWADSYRRYFLTYLLGFEIMNAGYIQCACYFNITVRVNSDIFYLSWYSKTCHAFKVSIKSKWTVAATMVFLCWLLWCTLHAMLAFVIFHQNFFNVQPNLEKIIPYPTFFFLIEYHFWYFVIQWLRLCEGTQSIRNSNSSLNINLTFNLIFTHFKPGAQVVPNLYEFLSSFEHKRRMLVTKHWLPSVLFHKKGTHTGLEQLEGE